MTRPPSLSAEAHGMNERDIGVSVGYQASLTMQVTQQHIDDFAGLCGDWHPMHRDPDYAAKTRFGKTVAHGVTPLALVSAVLGTQVGGRTSRLCS